MRRSIEYLFLVLVLAFCGMLIDKQKSTLKKLQHSVAKSNENSPSNPNFLLRKIEKSEVTAVYTDRQEYRDTAVSYNYTSVHPNTKVTVKSAAGKTVYHADKLSQYRLNIYDPKLGYRDEQNRKTFELPSDANDGYYFIAIEDQSGTFSHPFIFNRKEKCDILVIASTNTWSEYNNWFRSYIAQAKLVGFEAAKKLYFPAASPLLNDEGTAPITTDMAIKESHLQKYLDKNRLDYCIVSNRQYDEGLQISDYKIILLPYFSEAWSRKGRERLFADVNRGVSVASLAAGNMFKEIEYYPEGIVITKAAAESEFQFISKILGTHYWFADPYRKNDQAPFEILDKTHWLFEGVEGNSFGEKNIFFQHASAFEADNQYDESTGFILVAEGRNKVSRNRSDMVVKEFPRGNFVVNFSSLGIIGSLEVDKNAGIIIRNILKRAIGRPK